MSLKKSAAAAATLLVLVGPLAACSSSSADSGAPAAVATAQRVSVDQFQSAIESGATIIDVRTPAEYESGHIDNAVNIDVQSPGFAAQIDKLDPAGTYAVYCRSGNRSRTATATMADHGFGHVVELSGGIAQWQAEGQPVS